VARLYREASQPRDWTAAKCAAVRAARPDPSLRKRGLLGMTVNAPTAATRQTLPSSVPGKSCPVPRWPHNHRSALIGTTIKSL
jgi:hypothetical protein